MEPSDVPFEDFALRFHFHCVSPHCGRGQVTDLRSDVACRFCGHHVSYHVVRCLVCSLSSRSCGCPKGTEPPVVLYQWPRTLRVLRLVTDFSGMDVPRFALSFMSSHFSAHHLAASEVNASAREFFAANHACDRVYHNVLHRPARIEGVDLYVAGSPCQPWSGYGLRLGQMDPRSQLFPSTLLSLHYQFVSSLRIAPN